MAHTNDASGLMNNHLRTITMICDIFQEEYRDGSTDLGQILRDVVDLYEGRWPAYEACQVTYHTIHHCTDVALLTARIMVGWNRSEPDTFSLEHFKMAICAALFHDSGYLKDRGDQVGHGGKYTFTHVERSKRMLADYLTARHWPEPSIAQTVGLVDATEFSHTPEVAALYPDTVTRNLACILGTADLIGQMSDINYMANINNLFLEFEEAYTLVGREELQRQGHRIYGSAAEILDETVAFYEHIVLPRLRHFGRMDRYLIAFFADGRNPYLENITANLAGQILNKEAQWQRIGSILTAIGTINQEQLREALRRQCKAGSLHEPLPMASFQKRFLSWTNVNRNHKTLGDILIDMEAVEPKVLCQGLLTQILPRAGFADLSRERVELLLKIAIILHSSCNDPWIFQQVLAMVAEQLDCAGGSILLAVPDRQEMIVAVSTLLAQEHFTGKTIPADKGLAGWVFLHGQPAIVNAIDQDSRFDNSCDRRSPSRPESLLAVPMYYNGTRFGVVEMFNTRGAGFTESDAALMVMVANIVAVSLGRILAQP